MADTIREFAPGQVIYTVIGALILQRLHDLTDAAAAEAIAFDITWHYALDIRAESDAHLCGWTLRNYRRLIIERGLNQVLFRFLIDLLIRAVGVDTTKQRLDLTAMRSGMRGLTRPAMLSTVSFFAVRLLEATC